MLLECQLSLGLLVLIAMSEVISTKISFNGPEKICLAALPFAKQILKDVENLMSFQGLSQYALTRRAPNGCVIECWSCFSIRQIVITHPWPVPPPKYDKVHCFCTSCIAIGKIKAIKETVFINETECEASDEIYPRCIDCIESYPTYDKFFCGDNLLYDVYVCSGPGLFSLFENVRAFDNTPYCVGSKVFVTPIADSTLIADQIGLKCFTNCGKNCFASSSSPVILVGILPISAAALPLRYVTHHDY